jgi:hypothetical protein
MTPKEKAWSIFFQFKNIPDKWKNEKVFQNYYAKQCALLAVDEMIKGLVEEDERANFDISHLWEFWKEVKQEIEKL